MIGINTDFIDPEDFFVLSFGFVIVEYNFWTVINLFEKIVFFIVQFLYIRQMLNPYNKYNHQDLQFLLIFP